MYVTSRGMLEKAMNGHYAVPAFNAENLEMVQAIIRAAEETRSPVMIQTTPSTVKYMTLYEAVAMVKSMAETVTVPVALHLDHCETYEGVRDGLRAGYSSVMIDGSKEPYEVNESLTEKVVRAAHRKGIPVEAELGTVGGKEDGKLSGVAYTDPDLAERFCLKTGIDSLAVAIGTAHGFYKGEPVLNYEVLSEVRKRVNVPLVLHGGSGLSEDAIRKTIETGISKVNFATELRAVATAAARLALRDGSIIDPKKFMGPAREAVMELCVGKIRLCGSDGMA